MIDFLETASLSSIVPSGIVVLLCLLLGWFSKEGRLALLFGGIFGALGFAIGSNSVGGFGHTDGLGFGLVAAAIFGTGGGCAGFLLGFGGCLLFCRGFRGAALGLMLVGLLHPLAIFAEAKLRPYLIEQEWEWWRVALDSGFPKEKQADANKHLSSPTRSRLALRFGTNSRMSNEQAVSESALEGLANIGWLSDAYQPMPEALARKHYQRYRLNPQGARFQAQNHILLLVQNPTLPPDLIRELGDTKDLVILREFLLNPAIPEDVLTNVRTRLTVMIADEKKKPNPEQVIIKEAEACLQAMDYVWKLRNSPSGPNASK